MSNRGEVSHSVFEIFIKINLMAVMECRRSDGGICENETSISGIMLRVIC